MTVSSIERTAGPFTRNGAQVDYPFTMRVFADTDILATQTTAAGVVSTLVLGSDYTVAVNADQRTSPGGTLTMLDAGGVAGETLDFTTELEATQSARLTNAGGFYPEVVENALDKLTILLQQQGVFGLQSVRAPFPEVLVALPSALGRANTSLGFDADGQPTVLTPVSGSAADVLTRLADAVDAAKGAALVAYNDALTYPAGSVGAALAEAGSSGGSFDIFDSLSASEQADVLARTCTLNVVAAIRAPFADGIKRVKFRGGTYYLGSYADGTNAVDLSTYGDNLTIETEGDVEFVMTTTSGHPRFFFLKGQSHFSLGDCRFRDLGYSAVYPGAGGVAVYYESETTDSANLRLGNIYCKRIGIGLQCVKADAGDIGRLRGISGTITVDEGTYGANFANLGDDVDLNLITTDCWRSYYVYGGQSHRINIHNRDPKTGTGQVNIANGVNATVIPKDTKDIHVRYSCRGTVPSVNHVLINCFADAPGTIDGVYLELDTPDIQAPVYFANYVSSGGAEKLTATVGIVVDNIHISGMSGGYISGTAAYSTKPYVNIRGLRWLDDFPVRVSQTREINFNPTVTPLGGGTFNPGVGGSVLQRCYASEGMLHVNTQIIFGTAPTLGTGAWKIDLPYPNKSSVVTVGVGSATHGGSYTSIVAIVGATDQFFVMRTNGSGTNVGAAAPFVWVATDELVVTLTYPL